MVESDRAQHWGERMCLNLLGEYDVDGAARSPRPTTSGSRCRAVLRWSFLMTCSANCPPPAGGENIK